ncbi:ATP-binding protein [Mesorhizobium sp. PL10]
MLSRWNSSAPLNALNGYLPLEHDAAHLFFQLVGRRYETGATLIISNRSVAEWGTVAPQAKQRTHQAVRRCLRSAPPPSGPSPAEPNVTFDRYHEPEGGAVLHDAKGRIASSKMLPKVLMLRLGWLWTAVLVRGGWQGGGSAWRRGQN